jgi:hypothetical protein
MEKLQTIGIWGHSEYSRFVDADLVALHMPWDRHQQSE